MIGCRITIKNRNTDPRSCFQGPVELEKLELFGRSSQAISHSHWSHPARRAFSHLSFFVLSTLFHWLQPTFSGTWQARGWKAKALRPITRGTPCIRPINVEEGRKRREDFCTGSTAQIPNRKKYTATKRGDFLISFGRITGYLYFKMEGFLWYFSKSD